MAAVTWEQVRDHFVRRLMLDAEWLEEAHGSVTWWPWFLSQRVYVRESGLWDSDPDDNYLIITADTPIARVPEAKGLELATAANAECPLGAAVWEDGVLRLTASLSLNPGNVPLLSWFHEIALAQATLAHRIALALRDDPEAVVLESAPSGRDPRPAPDGLLDVFDGEQYGLPIPDDYRPALDGAREHLRQLMAESGWEPGFHDGVVDFFTHPAAGIEVAIGARPDDPITARFGPGLFLLVRVLAPGTAFDPWLANDANQIVSRLPRHSQLGPILGEPTATAYGSHLCCYLTCGFLAEHRLDPAGLGISIFNCVLHGVATVRGFLSVAFGPADHS